MQFDKDTFKPWIGKSEFGLKEGWNPITLTQLKEYISASEAEGLDMSYAKSCVASCQTFMDGIEPALVQPGPMGQENTVFSVFIEGGIFEGINGPKLKRYEDTVILQVGLSRYEVTINETGKVTIGNLSGVAIVEPVTKEENGVKVQLKDKNGIPRFQAYVNLMDFSDEDSEEDFRVWFAFEKELKDANGNFVTPTAVKLNKAIQTGKIFNYLAEAKFGGGSSTNNEDTVWFDMRMLPKGFFKVNKIVGPKNKTYPDGTAYKEWYFEMEDLGMTTAHKSLVSALERNDGFYKQKAEKGDLFIQVTKHDVEFKQVATNTFKQVPYFPDFIQAWNSGEVVKPERGIAGKECKHYINLELVTGVDYIQNPILGGIVNQALSIAVKPNSVALPAATVVAEPVAELKSAAVVEEDAADLDSIPF